MYFMDLLSCMYMCIQLNNYVPDFDIVLFWFRISRSERIIHKCNKDLSKWFCKGKINIPCKQSSLSGQNGMINVFTKDGVNDRGVIYMYMYMHVTSRFLLLYVQLYKIVITDGLHLKMWFLSCKIILFKVTCTFTISSCFSNIPMNISPQRSKVKNTHISLTEIGQ